MAWPAKTRLFPHIAAYFISNLRNLSGGRAYSQPDCFTRDTLRAVLQWLISDCHLFGLPVQNWMWVFPSALLLYLAVLTIIRRRQTGIR
jgi:hypothetical protein